MPRLRRALVAAGGFLLPWAPLPAASLLALGAAGAAGRWRGSDALLWAAFGVPPALLLLLAGHPLAAAAFAGQALLGFAILAFARPPAGALARALSVGLVATALALTGTQLAAGRLFATQVGDDSAWQAARAIARAGERISGTRQRAWHLEAAAAARLELSMSVRRVAGTVGWDWYAHGPVMLERRDGEGGTFARFAFGPRGDPYVQRFLDLGEPLGGRTFRLTLDLRAPAPIDPAPCRGPWLQVWGEGGGRACLAAAVGTSWSTSSLTWTVPAAARSGVLRVVLNNFEGSVLEARHVEVDELRGGAWRTVGALEPDGVTVVLTAQGPGGSSRSTRTLRPTARWQEVHVELDAPAGARTATAALATHALGVAVRDVRLTGGGARPLTPVLRQSLGAADPNLAGHALAALALVALAAAPTAAPATIAFLAGVLAVWWTGSRTALAALALFGGLLLVVRGRRHRRALAVLVVAIALAAAALIAASLLRVGPARDLTLNLGQQVPRPAIWGVALRALAEHPVRGLAGAGTTFGAVWAGAHGGSGGIAVLHAHDFWLQMASLYGVVGLVCAFALTGGMLVAAWRRAGLPATIAVAGVLFMNIFDTTLLSIGVLVAVSLAMNGDPPARRSVVAPPAGGQGSPEGRDAAP